MCFSFYQVRKQSTLCKVRQMLLVFGSHLLWQTLSNSAVQLDKNAKKYTYKGMRKHLLFEPSVRMELFRLENQVLDLNLISD